MPAGPRGGTETFWRCWGEGAARLLLLHCSLAHSGAWAPFAAALGRAAIAPDAPGHGKSGPADPGRDFQDQCLAQIEDFTADVPMDIVGHSFGATVALRLALERPDRVRRLVLIEPVLFAAARGSAEFRAYLEVLRPFNEAIAEGDTMLAAERFTAMWGTGADWESLRREQQHDLASRIAIIPAEDAALFGDRAGLTRPGRLEALATPALLVEGAASPPVIGAISAVLARRIPAAGRAVVAGAGHMLPITHPAEVAAIVDDFLSR